MKVTPSEAASFKTEFLIEAGDWFVLARPALYEFSIIDL
jgi:hypothetical protein